MKFLVPNYSCLQNPCLGGYRPQIPVLSVLCPQLNLLNPPPYPNKIPGYTTAHIYTSGTTAKCGDSSSISGRPVLDLWWLKRHRDGILSDVFNFSLSLLSHERSVLFHSSAIKRCVF